MMCELLLSCGDVAVDAIWMTQSNLLLPSLLTFERQAWMRLCDKKGNENWAVVVLLFLIDLWIGVYCAEVPSECWPLWILLRSVSDSFQNWSIVWMARSENRFVGRYFFLSATPTKGNRSKPLVGNDWKVVLVRAEPNPVFDQTVQPLAVSFRVRVFRFLCAYILFLRWSRFQNNGNNCSGRITTAQPNGSKICT